MDLRSKGSKERKRVEAHAEREHAARQRELVRQFGAEAIIKQKEEERMGVKATRFQDHAEELRGHRDDSVCRIAGYHRHIDNCTQEMKDCDSRIDEYRARVRSQQDLIRSRRAEAETSRQEADRCRAEADSSAILETRERELGNTK